MLFIAYALQETGIAFEKEVRFHKTRKWRFDYANTEHKIAVEVEGGLYNYGRHNRPKGFIADAEKYNTATSMGWKVIRVTPKQLLTAGTLELIRETKKAYAKCL